MSEWGSCKARTLYRALLGIGWSLKREAKDPIESLSIPAFQISHLRFMIQMRSDLGCWPESRNTLD